MSSLGQPLSAESLAHALGGKRVGKGWMARCPAHDDRNPSLSISDKPNGGNPLVKCHGGCSQDAVIAELKQRNLWARVTGSASARTDAPPRANQSPRAEPPTAPDNQKKATAAHEAQSIWNSCKPAPQDHPYLREKQIEAYGARVENDHLVIPIQDTEGNFHGLQYISPAGDKRFHSGSSITGHFYLFGDEDPAKPLCIAEGFATTATVHQATGSQVAVAFNAGNLTSVAEALRDKWQNREIVLCADDDAKTDGNPGLTKAHEAALSIGAKVASPNFGDQRPEGVTDFNDLAQLDGLEAVRESIRAAKDPLWPEPQPLTGKIDFAPYPLDALQWIVPVDDLVNAPIASPWLIKNWLQQNALMMIHGPSGCGKTFVVLDMCLHAASDATMWHGFPVKTVPVLYLAGEGGHGLGQRVSVWNTYHKKHKTKLFVSRGARNLNTKPSVDFIKKEAEIIQEAPKLIVVDTLHRFFDGDENRAGDIKTMISACDELMRAFDCSVLFVHHTGLSGDALTRGRGSSAISAAMDVEMNLKRNKDGEGVSLMQVKSKDSELAKSLSLSFESVTIPNKKYDDDGTPVSSLVITSSQD